MKSVGVKPKPACLTIFKFYRIEVKVHLVGMVNDPAKTC